MVAEGGAAWLAIKAELRFMNRSINAAKREAERAHTRIDHLYEIR